MYNKEITKKKCTINLEMHNKEIIKKKCTIKKVSLQE